MARHWRGLQGQRQGATRELSLFAAPPPLDVRCNQHLEALEMDVCTGARFLSMLEVGPVRRSSCGAESYSALMPGRVQELDGV